MDDLIKNYFERNLFFNEFFKPSLDEDALFDIQEDLFSEPELESEIFIVSAPETAGITDGIAEPGEFIIGHSLGIDLNLQNQKEKIKLVDGFYKFTSFSFNQEELNQFKILKELGCWEDHEFPQDEQQNISPSFIIDLCKNACGDMQISDFSSIIFDLLPKLSMDISCKFGDTVEKLVLNGKIARIKE